MSSPESDNQSYVSPQQYSGTGEIIQGITQFPPGEGDYSKYANRSAYAVLGVDDFKKKELYENALANLSQTQPRKEYTAESYRSTAENGKSVDGPRRLQPEQVIDNVAKSYPSSNQNLSNQNLQQWTDSYPTGSFVSLKNPMKQDNRSSSSDEFSRSKVSKSPSLTPSMHPKALTKSNSSKSFWIGGNSIVPEPGNTNIKTDTSSKKASITSVLPEPASPSKKSFMRGSSQGDLSTVDSGSDSPPLTTSNIDSTAHSAHPPESSHLFCKRIQTSSYLNVIRFVRGSVPKVLCASSDSTIHVYGVADGKVFPPLEGHTDRVISLAVSNPFFSYEEEHSHGSGRHSNKVGKRKVLKTLVASGSRDEILKVWDLDTGKCIVSIHAHNSPIWTVAITVRKDSSVIVASGAADGTLRTWNGKTGKKLLNLKTSAQKILCSFILNVVPEYPFLLSGGSDKCIHIWDLTSGKSIRTLEGHEDEVTSISAGNYPGLPSLMPLLSDKNKDRGLGSSSSSASLGDNNPSTHGLIIVSGSRDMSVRVWHLNTGVLLFELFGHRGCVYEVSIIRCIGKVPTKFISPNFFSSDPFADNGCVISSNKLTEELSPSHRCFHLARRSSCPAETTAP